MTVREFGNWLLDLQMWEVIVFVIAWYAAHQFTTGLLNGIQKAKRQHHG